MLCSKFLEEIFAVSDLFVQVQRKRSPSSRYSRHKDASFPFHRHLFILCHLLGKGFFSMLADITDAGGSVAIEQESKDLANKVIVDFAFLYILVALGASVKAFFLATLSDLAP